MNMKDLLKKWENRLGELNQHFEADNVISENDFTEISMVEEIVNDLQLGIKFTEGK